MWMTRKSFSDFVEIWTERPIKRHEYNDIYEWPNAGPGHWVCAQWLKTITGFVMGKDSIQEVKFVAKEDPDGIWVTRDDEGYLEVWCVDNPVLRNGKWEGFEGSEAWFDSDLFEKAFGFIPERATRICLKFEVIPCSA